MGKIKKILENELTGGNQSTDVYPITSTKAVYDEDNERLDHILNRRGVVNISTNYNADHIAEVLTLEQAITKVPSKDRVLGFQGKFLSENGWKSYVFIGDSIADWTNKTKWNNYLTGTDIVQESGEAEDKVMSQKAVLAELDKKASVTENDSSSDLDISDDKGNVLCKFENGHIKTKNFNSAELDKKVDIAKKPQYLYKLDSSMTDINLGGFSNKNGILYSNNNFGISNSLILNREYALSTKYMICDFSLEQNGIAYFHTIKGIDSSARLGATMVSVDMANKKLCFHKPSHGGSITSIYRETLITSMHTNEKYRICIAKLNWNIVATLYDLKTFEIIASLTYKCYDWNTTDDGVGYACDKFAIFADSANITIYNILVSTPKINTCELMIYGDSITEGLYAVTEDKTYGHIIGEKIGPDKILVSGRVSGTILGVLERLKTEAAIVKPKYISVMIGTNGGNSVERIVEMGKLIASIGAIPIINTVICSNSLINSSTNNIIKAGIESLKKSGINVLSVNLDIATALNKDISQGPDKSYFNIKEGLHPNDNGHQAMANQFYIDIPEIFNW